MKKGSIYHYTRTRECMSTFRHRYTRCYLKGWNFVHVDHQFYNNDGYWEDFNSTYHVMNQMPRLRNELDLSPNFSCKTGRVHVCYETIAESRLHQQSPFAKTLSFFGCLRSTHKYKISEISLLLIQEPFRTVRFFPEVHLSHRLLLLRTFPPSPSCLQLRCLHLTAFATYRPHIVLPHPF